MVIKHNLPAMSAANFLWKSETKISKVIEKLSSGYRINRAADDAAGLAVSEKMRAQITGLKQAHLNSSNGISVVQTAEGALAESHAILQRMGELAVESMNGIYTPEDRQKLDDEYQQLLEELDRIAQGTNFNGIKLLDGSLARSHEVFGGINGGGTAGGSSSVLPVPNTPSLPAVAWSSTQPAITLNSSKTVIDSSGVYEIADGFSGTITVKTGCSVLIKQASATTLNNVTIQCENNVDVTFQDLNIENTSDNNVITFEGSANILRLSGSNKILVKDDVDREFDKALIRVQDDAELMIGGTGSISFRTSDILHVLKTELNAALIGGDKGKSAGKISLLEGTISGDTFGKGAGIGGGEGGNGGNITIYDANIRLATHGGACIGGGENGDGGNISIYGNESKIRLANSLGGGGAGVGGGKNGNGGNILINAGQRSDFDYNFTSQIGGTGAGIGGGENGNSGNITINGGRLFTFSLGGGAGIGGGYNGHAQTITINGGDVSASSALGAGIGGGQMGNGGKIVINGGITSVDAPDATAVGGGGGYFDLGQSAGNGAELIINGGLLAVLSGEIGGGYLTEQYDYTAIHGRGGSGSVTINNGGLYIPDPESMIQAYPPKNEKGSPLYLQIIENAGKQYGMGFPDGAMDIIMKQGLLDIVKSGITYYTYQHEDGNAYIWTTDKNDEDERRNDGGLILQIGTDNEEYDKLRIYIDDMSTRGLMVAGTNILTIENAEEASDWCYYAIGRVSENRGRLGAYQNRLEHNINGLTVAEENMTAAESRLRDADMAKEMTVFTIGNVIAQAAQAMLAQANQKSSDVLELLK